MTGTTSMSRFYNRTRRSASIPARLLREGKWYLLPVYSLLLTSDLAREGIRNSGSSGFADHIYAARPSGRYGIGRLVDACLLALPSARAFRARYRFAKDEIHRLIAGCASRPDGLDILAVPCGLAREVFEAAAELRVGRHPHRRNVRWHGIDLDPQVVASVSCRATQSDAPMEFWIGDALDPAAYRKRYDMVISTGFTEFLDNSQTVEFYRTVRAHLRPGGLMVTSGMLRHSMVDYLLRHLAELQTSYRDERTLRELAGRAGFSTLCTYRDRTGLQTMVVATNEVGA